MKKMLLSFLILLFVGLSSMYAQNVITGKVTTSEDGSSIPGVNVVVQGTNLGTVTDIDGKYTLKVDESAEVLVFTFMGYTSQSTTIGSQTTINVVLEPSSVALGEVVVTALGISREKKSLAFSTQQLDAAEINVTKNPSVVNSLEGKVAGLVVNRSASGTGGSSRVTLRGNKSTRNNQPLYVIDGVPMLNYSPSQPGGVMSSGYDGGDALSSINPDDIESISVLKGASAAALYGSQAANGAIMITTKKGKSGKGKITFSSTYTFDQAIAIPEMQFKYGQTAEGSLDSWGEPLATESNDFISDFYRGGNTWVNSLSFSGGNEKAQTYMSYSNTKSNSILPGTDMSRHNFDFKENMSFFNGKLEVGANLNYLYQVRNNLPSHGLYFNPLTGLYNFPRGLDFEEYASNYEVYNPDRNVDVQNWPFDFHTQQNPYWIINRNKNQTVRNRVFTGVNFKYTINDNFNIIARGNLDKTFDRFDRKSFASTQTTIADYNGRYQLTNTEGTQYYADLIANYHYRTETLNITANVGTSFRDETIYSENFDSKNAGMKFANVFSLQNMGIPGGQLVSMGQSQGMRRQLQGVFANVQLGYKSLLYMDISGRNDWSSTLPDQSYFYPSVGLSGIISELVDTDWLDFAKLRVSYAIVGNDVSPYVANPIQTINSVTGLQTLTIGLLPGTSLVPEKSKSFEIGMDIRTFDNRLNLDITYYKTNTENQFVTIAAPQGSGVNAYLVNAGNIQNKGIEATLEIVPVKTTNLKWSAIFNVTKNENTVLEMHESLENGVFYLAGSGLSHGYGMAITEGGSFGDIYGKMFLRDDNDNIVVDADGKPLDGGEGMIGNPNPDFMLGFNNIVSYKKWIFRLLIDGRFGGQVLSITQAMTDGRGSSIATAEARDNGGVDIGAVYEDGTSAGLLNPQDFYTTVGNRAGTSEYYMYDATNIRLRELSIAYTFNIKSNVISGITTSLVGRNLFFFMNKAPYDPEISMSTATGYQGVDVFALPTTRSFGLNLTLHL